MSGNLTNALTMIRDLEDVENKEDDFELEDVEQGFLSSVDQFWNDLKELGKLMLENWEAALLITLVIVGVVVVSIMLAPVGTILGAALEFAGVFLMILTMVSIIETGIETGQWDYALG